MPLFLPVNQVVETSSFEFAANTLTIAQTLFLSVVETPGYPISVSSMECFFSVVNGSNPTIELGIYNWNTSGNGSLVASATVVPNAAGFWTVTFASPVTLLSRTKYYFAYLNRTAADATTSLGVVGANTFHIQICATMASQTSMPANLASLSTTNGNRLTLRAYT